MIVQGLTRKFHSNLLVINSFIYARINKNSKFEEVSLNDLYTICTEVSGLTDKIYFELENLYLKKEHTYPIIIHHMDYLTQHVEVSSQICTKYLDDFQAGNIKYDNKEEEIWPLVLSLLESLHSFSDKIRTLYEIIENKSNSENKPTAFLKETRTLKDIVLQYIWEGKIITRQNKDSIANQLTLDGIIELTNGNKLYNDFCHYNQKCNRTGDQASDRKNQKHLELMIKASMYLKEDKHIETAENDIHTFKENAEKISGTIL